jgi:hypothetical protein
MQEPQMTHAAPTADSLDSNSPDGRTMQRAGGVAAVFIALSFVLGFGMYLTVLGSSSTMTVTEKIEFFTDNELTLLIVTTILYLGAGVALVPLSLGIHRRLAPRAPTTMHIATVFGLIWAGVVIASGMIQNIGVATVVDQYPLNPDQAASAWVAIEVVADALGGGSEMIGGIWVLLVTAAAWRTGALPRGLNYLGLVIAAAGLLTVVPALTIFQDVFGLAQIPWFFWLGATMLRSNHRVVSTQSHLPLKETNT